LKKEKKDYNKDKVSEISRKIKVLNEERKWLIKESKEIDRSRGNEKIMETRGKHRIIGNIQIAPPRDEYKKDQNQIRRQGRMGSVERLESFTDEQESQRGGDWTN